MMRLTRVVLTLLAGVSLGGAAASGPKLPPGFQGWRFLARLPDLPPVDVVPSETLVPDWKGAGILMFTSEEEIELPFPAPAPGRYEVTLTYLTGDRFPALSVSVGSQPRVQLNAGTGAPEPQLDTFTASFGKGKTPVVLRRSGPGPCALYGIHLRLLNWQRVPASAWRVATLTPDLEEALRTPDAAGYPEADWTAPSSRDESTRGDGRTAAVTHFHAPEIFANRLFRLRATSAARLIVNGREVAETEDDAFTKPSTVLWTAWKPPGIARIAVLTDGGASFQLETSPLRGGRFLTALPDHCLPLHLQKTSDWPMRTLTNGVVRATVPVPVIEGGYYRGHRFEKAGMITSLTVGGHSYFTEYGSPHNPAITQHGAGPAEEFLEPVGFTTAAPGESFLKVGVGVYERPADSDYFHGSPYWPVKHFPWTSRFEPGRAVFRQNVSDFRGWGYRYEKRLVLPSGKARLRIEHTFTNTGGKRIRTSQYAHNYVLVDGKPGGPDYRISFDFHPVPARSVRSRLDLSGSTFRPRGPQTYFTPVFGCLSARPEWATVLHQPTEAGVRLGGDFPPYRIHLFGDAESVCVEPFYHLDVAPGETRTWRRTYTFFDSADKPPSTRRNEP